MKGTNRERTRKEKMKENETKANTRLKKKKIYVGRKRGEEN